MKWASNKRLHLEIASLKAVQNLEEIRLTDVISAIGRADPEEIAESLSTPATPSPVTAPAKTAPEPAPASLTPEPISKEEPENLTTIDKLIASAPEESIDPEPVKLNPEPAAPKPEAKEEVTPKEEEAPAEDEFHSDPLIVEALKVFKGRLIS